MNIHAITYGHTKEDEKLIQNMAHYVGYHHLNITDIKSYQADLNQEWMIFVYGSKALRTLKTQAPNTVNIVSLPELSELINKEENKAHRAEAFKTLQELREAANGKIKASESISCLDVNRIEDDIRKQGVKKWIGKLSNGKSISITLEPSPKENTDISITFRELLALKAAMDTFQIKEFLVVYNDEIHSKLDS